MRVLIGLLQKIESGLLAVILLLLIVLAAWQVMARNLFDGGLLWGDGFVRVAVLWVTLIGAMVASRTDDHIRMDVVTRYLPEGLQRFSRRLTALFTALVCGSFAWFSLSFVREEMQYGAMAFGDVPVWMCAMVMPVGFAIMAARYVLHSIVLPATQVVPAAVASATSESTQPLVDVEPGEGK